MVHRSSIQFAFLGPICSHCNDMHAWTEPIPLEYDFRRRGSCDDDVRTAGSFLARTRWLDRDIYQPRHFVAKFSTTPRITSEGTHALERADGCDSFQLCPRL